MGGMESCGRGWLLGSQLKCGTTETTRRTTGQGPAPFPAYPCSPAAEFPEFLDLRLDRLAPLWTGKPVLDIPAPPPPPPPFSPQSELQESRPWLGLPLLSPFYPGICSASEQPPNLQC